MALEYTVQIDLDLPRERVVELFADPEHMPKWQRGFIRATPIDGEPGQAGAKRQLVYKMGRGEMEMVETVVAADLPERFDCTYDAKNVHNVVRNRFVELGPEKTRWESENEFQFSGFMKVIGFLMKGAFPKQSLKYMTDFKAFAEQGADVRDEA